MDPTDQQVDAPSDFGTDEAAKVSRWISELDLSEKDQRKYISRGREIIKRYSMEQTATAAKERTFSLLWANTQTLAPAVYARTPTAVVGRRWKDGDPIARTASEIVERALNFSLDAMDFADTMVSLRDEYLLVARGQARVRYVPHLGPVEDTGDGEVTDNEEKAEEVIWEEVVADHVHWEDWGTNPARTWAEVRMVWFRAYMTRDELVKRFGAKKGKACPLDWKLSSDKNDGLKDDQFAKAAVYEIWDKTSKTVFWVCKAFTDALLDERPDPLGLKHFFPCPRALLGTCGPNSIIPTPDYDYYVSQAKEIDDLTKRISLLTDALKVRGFYAATEGQKFTDLFAAETNTLIPIDSWAAMADKGGMKGLIEWFPVEMVADTLKSCIETRKQMIDDVYQITGIADIMRGDTDPNETAAAQQLKSNWGSSRVRDKQKELGRFVRDLLVIMGEVVSGKFSVETLTKMTGVSLLPSPEVKQQIQQQMAMQAQLAQQAQQVPPAGGAGGVAPPAPPAAPPADPKMVRMLNDPTWAEVEGLLRDDAMRSFRIDIETDSTIEPNDQQEKQRRVEFIEAVGQYLEKTLTVVQLAPEMLPVVVEGLKFLVRGFRVGREMEDVIEMALDKLQAKAEAAAANPQPQGQDPAAMMKAQADQTRAQASVMKAQADQGHLQVEAGKVQSQHQIGMAEVQAENERTAADRGAELHMHSEGLKADLNQAVVAAIQRGLKSDITSKKPMDVHTP